MSELKPCPFCGRKPYESGGYVSCHTEECLANADYHEPAIGSIEDWNTRPIEDALNKRIAELEAENERLAQLLHDEMSQLEIATDLGNKRWTALNKIYEDGEKHNTNWCKRIAQEGLGIK
ncbi:MAG: hypothetical protein GX457_13780 [Thermotogaceae bacterium]|nr:hypothetical protein [Thermotogaceae bacterium]